MKLSQRLKVSRTDRPMRRLRFQLASLIVAVMATAVLWGANVSLRIVDDSDARTTSLSCWSGDIVDSNPIPAMRHERVVKVAQGWPLPFREEKAYVNVARTAPMEASAWEYSASVSRWWWSDNVEMKWVHLILNSLLVLCVAGGVLFGAEKFLCKRPVGTT